MLDYQLVTGLYVLFSLCVVYKLAYFVRQTAPLSNPIIQPMRWVAAAIGTGIIYRVVQITNSNAWVETYDAVSQLMWCAILYLFIMAIGRKKHVW